MQKLFVPLMGLALVAAGTVHAVEKKVSYSKFYGKIVGVNVEGQSLTVHNKKNKLDAAFKWDEETEITLQKKPVRPAELKVGQSLIVAYVMENNGYKAKRITVRPATSRKKQPEKLFE